MEDFNDDHLSPKFEKLEFVNRMPSHAEHTASSGNPNHSASIRTQVP